MSDIATLEKEIRQMLETLNLDIESLNKKDPSQRAKQILRCQNKIIEIRTRIEAFELETLQLDKFSQAQYKDTLKTLQTEYKDLKGQFERKKAEKAPGDARYAAEERVEKNLDEMNGQELVQVGHKTQQQGMDALKRVLGQIEGANERADAINVELQRQDEVIVRSKEKAMDVQTEIKRAGQYLRYFARQVYTDKILMCMIFLCIVAILVIIIMKIVKKESIPTVQDIIKSA